MGWSVSFHCGLKDLPPPIFTTNKQIMKLTRIIIPFLREYKGVLIIHILKQWPVPTNIVQVNAADIKSGNITRCPEMLI